MIYENNVDKILDSYYDEKDSLYEKVLTKNGSVVHYKDGDFHRDGGPAIVDQDGGKTWFYEGLRHRENGPAITEPDGTKEYWIKGKLIKAVLPERWFRLLNSCDFETECL